MQDTANRPELIKRANKSLILRIINKENSISRAELSRKTKLAIPTVMKIVDELIKEDLLVEVGIGESTLGRPPKLLELNPRGNYAIAVKIIPDELQIAVANLKNEFLTKVNCSINPNDGYEKILFQLKKTIKQAVEKSEASFRDIVGIGIGVPGVINYSKGEVIFASNLKGWKNLALGPDLQEEFNIPVFIENEARVSTLAEKWYGIGREVRNFVCVDVAVGIGAGIVINGNLYRGFESLAGEIGHCIALENGPLCNCGKRGCLETVASNTAILRSIKKDPSPIIKELCQQEGGISLTMKQVIEAVKMGDKKSQKCIQKAARYLGRVIGQLVNIINPEVVIVNGDITLTAKVFFDPLREEVEKYAFCPNNKRMEIIPSKLGRDAGLIGAASLVLRKIFKV